MCCHFAEFLISPALTPVSVEVAEYLLSKGANLDAQDAFGVTPLLAAVYEGTPALLRLFS